MTAYDGNAISYDAIGNPLSYDGWSFTWQKGRQLKTMSKGSTSLSFKYNENGIRTSKTVNGVETQYFLDGSTIIAQKTGNTTLWFYYDGNGKLTAMQNGDNGAYYYYVYNNQGDVIGLLDSDFNFVANYTYDSWGKLISVTGSNTTIGNLNPFRYRGYYYDSETGLYYLQSRYYNPEICRFINSDSIVGVNGNSMSGNFFAYCSNNPTALYDPNGKTVYSISLGFSVNVFLGTYLEVAIVWDDHGNIGWTTDNGMQIGPSDKCSPSFGIYKFDGYDTISDCSGFSEERNKFFTSKVYDKNGNEVGVGITNDSTTTNKYGFTTEQTTIKESIYTPVQYTPKTCPGHSFGPERFAPGFPSHIRQRSCTRCGYTFLSKSIRYEFDKLA